MTSADILPKLNSRRFSLTIRAIAMVLAVTLIAQDIVWADPELSTLAPQSFSQRPEKQTEALGIANRILDYNSEFNSNSHSTPTVNNKYSAPYDGGDVVNPIIRWHIDKRRYVVIDAVNNAVTRAVLNGEGVRDHPLEQRFTEDGVFEKIRAAQDIDLMKKLIKNSPNLNKLNRKDKKALLSTATKVRVSLILEWSIVGCIDNINGSDHKKRVFYATARTGFSRYWHGLDPTVTMGENLFYELSVEQLAKMLLEESQHIVKPEDIQSDGTHTNVDDDIDASDVDESNRIHHDQSFVDEIEAIVSGLPEDKMDEYKTDSILHTTSAGVQDTSGRPGKSNAPGMSSGTRGGISWDGASVAVLPAVMAATYASSFFSPAAVKTAIAIAFLAFILHGALATRANMAESGIYIVSTRWKRAAMFTVYLAVDMYCRIFPFLKRYKESNEKYIASRALGLNLLAIRTTFFDRTIAALLGRDGLERAYGRSREDFLEMARYVRRSGSDFLKISEMVGPENLRSNMRISDSTVRIFLEGVEAVGGYGKLTALHNFMLSDYFRTAFAGNCIGLGAALIKIGRNGGVKRFLSTVDKVSGRIGKNNIRRAFASDPYEFVNVIEKIRLIGPDKFNKIMDGLSGCFPDFDLGEYFGMRTTAFSELLSNHIIKPSADTFLENTLPKLKVFSDAVGADKALNYFVDEPDRLFHMLRLIQPGTDINYMLSLVREPKIAPPGMSSVQGSGDVGKAAAPAIAVVTNRPKTALERIKLYVEDADIPAVENIIKNAPAVIGEDDTTILFRALHARNIGDVLRKKIRDYLILANYGLALSYAKENYKSHELDDVRQYAMMGLIDAVDQFNYTRGFKFSTFAIQVISHKVNNEMNMARAIVSRYVWGLIREFTEGLEQLSYKLRRMPNAQDAEDAGLKFELAKDSNTAADPIFVNRLLGSETVSRLLHLIPADTIGGEDAEDVIAAFPALRRKEQVLLKMICGMGTNGNRAYTLSEIAQIFSRGCSGDKITTKQNIFRMKDAAVDKINGIIAGEDNRRNKKITAYSADHADVFLVEVMHIQPDDLRFESLMAKGRRALEAMHAAGRVKSAAPAMSSVRSGIDELRKGGLDLNNIKGIASNKGKAMAAKHNDDNRNGVSNNSPMTGTARMAQIREFLDDVKSKISNMAAYRAFEKDFVEAYALETPDEINRFLAECLLKDGGTVDTRESQHVLFRAMHDMGMSEEKRLKIRKYLIEKNMRLAQYMVEQLSQRYGIKDHDEAISRAYSAIIDAVDMFDYTKKNLFSTYGAMAVEKSFITAKIKEKPRAESFYVKKRAIYSRKFQDETQRLGREPTLDEMADITGFKIEEIFAINMAPDVEISALAEGDGSIPDLAGYDRDVSGSDSDEEMPLNGESLGDLLSYADSEQQVMIKMIHGLGTTLTTTIVRGKKKEENKIYTLKELGNIFGYSKENARLQIMKGITAIKEHVSKVSQTVDDNSDVYLVEVMGILPKTGTPTRGKKRAENPEFKRLLKLGRAYLESMHASGRVKSATPGMSSVSVVDKDWGTQPRPPYSAEKIASILKGSDYVTLRIIDMMARYKMGQRVSKMPGVSGRFELGYSSDDAAKVSLIQWRMANGCHAWSGPIREIYERMFPGEPYPGVGQDFSRIRRALGLFDASLREQAVRMIEEEFSSRARQVASAKESFSDIHREFMLLGRPDETRSKQRILLSANIFRPENVSAEADLDTAGNLIALRSVLVNSDILIMESGEMRKEANRRVAGRDNLMMVMTNLDYESNEILNGSDKQNWTKSGILILNDRLSGENYLYLEGVLGMARAIMNSDKTVLRSLYGLITGQELREDIAALAMSDPVRFALAAALRFKPITPKDAQEFVTLKLGMESALIAA